MSLSSKAESSFRARGLLAGSLLLNVVLAAAAVTMGFRHSAAAPLQPVAGIKHSVADRLDRIAASLPTEDAQLMRQELRTDAAKLAAAEAELRLSQQAVRDRLRADPFDPNAMRAAMAVNSEARDHYYEVLHEAVATVTAKMSVTGRKMLADWPVRRGNTVVTQ